MASSTQALYAIGCLQEVTESGAEVFTTLLAAGTPLPARRHHTFGGAGTAASVSIDLYQRCVTQPPEKLARVTKPALLDVRLSSEASSYFNHRRKDQCGLVPPH